MWMYLDDQAVGARRDRALRRGIHQAGSAGAMAGIDYHRQVTQLLDDRYCREVKQIAAECRITGRGHAALAQHYLAIALAQDIFRSEQPVLDRGIHAAA